MCMPAFILRAEHPVASDRIRTLCPSPSQMSSQTSSPAAHPPSSKALHVHLGLLPPVLNCRQRCPHSCNLSFTIKGSLQAQAIAAPDEIHDLQLLQQAPDSLAAQLFRLLRQVPSNRHRAAATRRQPLRQAGARILPTALHQRCHRRHAAICRHMPFHFSHM